VVAVFPFVAACRGEVVRQDTASPASTKAPPARAESAVAWAVPPTKHYLTCAPDTVGPDDALILRMQAPHGASLHISGPDGTPFIVVFHGEGQRDRGARHSLMRPEVFARLTELRLLVRTTTAGVWVFGRDTNEVVFRAPGVYRVRVGNDMETDGPDYAECLVTYRPR
jgi:hypothetical protein